MFTEAVTVILDLLIPGTTYTCEVYASTTAGSGPPTSQTVATDESMYMASNLIIIYSMP